MNLLFDLGNTRIKWALASSVDILKHGAIANRPANSELSRAEFDAELVREIRKLLDGQKVEAILLSSVASLEVVEVLMDALETEYGLTPIQVRATDPLKGFDNLYDSPAKLGVDRWLAAIGARNLIKNGDLIVVDAGTAVTIDLLNSENEFVGGVIMPGLGLMHAALTGNTANINTQLKNAEHIIGKNTQDCVDSGVLYGLVGGIEKVIEKVIAQMINLSGSKSTPSSEVSILLTGGAASQLMPLLDLKCQQQYQITSSYCPHLVMRGLLEYSRNHTS